MCQSVLQNRIHCYRAVIHEKCNVSATDVNVLNSVIYNAKFAHIVNQLCTLGESHGLLLTVVRPDYTHL